MTATPTALIIGAGDALGGAIARRFAREGLTAVPARRNEDQLAPLVEQIRAEGGKAVALGLDARQEDLVRNAVERVEKDIGPIEVMVFNIGANMPFPMVDTPPRKFFKLWEMGCYAGFLCTQAVARHMIPRERGTIIFTGATASLRGGANFAAFATAKHGLRALAQSTARELGPKGVHVAHVVIDGVIDTAWIRENFPSLIKNAQPDGIMQPDLIAENYVYLHKQPRSAWTHELDLRPWCEKW